MGQLDVAKEHRSGVVHDSSQLSVFEGLAYNRWSVRAEGVSVSDSKVIHVVLPTIYKERLLDLVVGMQVHVSTSYTDIHVFEEIGEAICFTVLEEPVLVDDTVQTNTDHHDSFTELVDLLHAKVLDFQEITVRQELDFRYISAKVSLHLIKQLPHDLMHLTVFEHSGVKAPQVVKKVFVGDLQHYAVWYSGHTVLGVRSLMSTADCVPRFP